MNTPKANLQPKATLSSSKSVSPASNHRRDGGRPHTGARRRCWCCGRHRPTKYHHSRPHGGADEGMKLDLAPHGPFRMLVRAALSLVATAPRSLSGVRQSRTRQRGGRRSGSVARRGQGGGRSQAGGARSLLETGSRSRRVGTVTGGGGAFRQGQEDIF